MISPDDFHQLARERLQESFSPCGSQLMNPHYGSTENYWGPIANMIGTPPNFRADVQIIGGGEVFELTPLQPGIPSVLGLIGGRYTIRFDPATWDQRAQLASPTQEGFVQLYQQGTRTDGQFSPMSARYMEAFFDLDSERTTYFGLNEFALAMLREAGKTGNSRLPDLQGLPLKEGLQQFFALWPQDSQKGPAHPASSPR